MDMRTKLVFAMVSVALGSMLALGVMMYRSAAVELEERTLEQLTGLAEFKVESLEGIVSGWRDRVRLVASRSELRSALAEYVASPSSATPQRIERILTEVLAASPVFLEIWVHDASEGVVAAAGTERPEPLADLGVAGTDRSEDVWFRGVVFPEDGDPMASFVAPLDIDGERPGHLHAFLSVDEVVDISTNYEGLGQTGETMVVTRGDDGPRTLHPVRAAPVADDGVDPSRFEGAGLLIADGAAAASLEGGERRFSDDAVDYRGQPIWAATDYLPETGWGVVVKVDTAEQRAPIVDFRDDVIRLSVALAAFAILFGTILGIRFAQPIHLLSGAANRIRDGDLSARSGIEREDEVGLLAQTFDKMAAELEEQVELLTEFRLFFDMSLDMMCIAATDGYFKRVNTSFTRELGWSEEDLLARPFVSMVHPDDVDATLAEIERLRSGTPTIRFENRYLCKDGTYKRLVWRTMPERGTGRLYAIARVIDGDSESL